MVLLFVKRTLPVEYFNLIDKACGFTLPEHLSRTEVSNEHSGSVNSPLEPSKVRKGGSFVFVVDPPAVGFPPNHQRDACSPLAQCKHHMLFTPIFAESNLVPGKLLNE
ncbi:hypothetical protein WA026_008182 [Henosepilachna vigintioctopunctata]|uniref:Uncharacterized protein n=1 Tax=Henosepilachna vigintioctopunctata TaxID=420089 RepID=A0AAW1TQJ9_9CUCU